VTEPAPSPAPPGAILVIDDEEMMRDLLRRMLERCGFAVVTAVHGRDGLERLHDGRVCLVITDMKMPEMDGVQLVRQLRVENPDIPIIAASGDADRAAYLRTAKDLGVDAAVQKPVGAADLVKIVRKLLGA
jgi:CheY-like chemotaxis protein